MVGLPVEGLAFKPHASGVKRLFDVRVAEVCLSVKDFGAVGNGSDDDTAAIQACFDYAFPNHGPSPAAGNGIVYIPPGRYKISRPLYLYSLNGIRITGAGLGSSVISHVGGTNAVFTATFSTATLGGIDAQYRTIMTVTGITSGTIWPGGQLSGSGIPAGVVVTTQLTGTAGSTGTYNVANPLNLGPTAVTSSNNTAICTNGVAYSTFEEFGIEAGAASGGIAFDWMYDNTGVGPTVCLFNHVGFSGWDYGCRVGTQGPQCDTSTWLDCNYSTSGHGIGIGFQNLNVLACSIKGGLSSGNLVGIQTTGGSCESITGIGFVGNTQWDIQIQGGNNAACCISGCNTESLNFVSVENILAGVTIIGCGQRGLGDGVFARANATGLCTVIGCMTNVGKITNGDPITVINSIFQRTDALASFETSRDQQLYVKNCLFGEVLARRVLNQRINAAGVRSFDLEATALTDGVVLYDSIVRGSLGENYLGVTVSSASPGVVNFGYNHWLVADQPVAFHTSGGSMPTGMSADTTYYVASAGLTTTTFTLRTQPGGAGSAVNTSSTGSNVRMRLVRKWARGDQLMKSDISAGSTSPGWICITPGVALTTAGAAAAFKTMAPVGA
jgi:hypothetical protein